LETKDLIAVVGIGLTIMVQTAGIVRHFYSTRAADRKEFDAKLADRDQKIDDIKDRFVTRSELDRDLRNLEDRMDSMLDRILESNESIKEHTKVHIDSVNEKIDLLANSSNQN